MKGVLLTLTGTVPAAREIPRHRNIENTEKLKAQILDFS